jgi:hypothetical protein
MTRDAIDDLRRYQAMFRLRRMVTLAAFCLLMVLFVIVKSKIISSEWLIIGFIGMVGVARTAWRCPRCGERFGMAFPVDACPHCYLSFAHRLPAGSGHRG